nr:MAG: RNase P/RNase MRP subunit p29 [Thermoproteus sp. AZ2]
MSCIDLLGKRVKVFSCGHDVEGLVVGESYNVVYLLKGDKTILVPKRPCKFLLLDEAKIVEGIYLVGYRDVRLLSGKCLKLPPKLS